MQLTVVVYLSGESGRYCFRNLFDGYARARESVGPESDDAIGS